MSVKSFDTVIHDFDVHTDGILGSQDKDMCIGFFSVCIYVVLCNILIRIIVIKLSVLTLTRFTGNYHLFRRPHNHYKINN